MVRVGPSPMLAAASSSAAVPSDVVASGEHRSHPLKDSSIGEAPLAAPPPSLPI